jgi:hypothetical protein
VFGSPPREWSWSRPSEITHSMSKLSREEKRVAFRPLSSMIIMPVPSSQRVTVRFPWYIFPRAQDQSSVVIVVGKRFSVCCSCARNNWGRLVDHCAKEAATCQHQRSTNRDGEFSAKLMNHRNSRCKVLLRWYLTPPGASTMWRNMCVSGIYDRDGCNFFCGSTSNITGDRPTGRCHRRRMD